MGCVQIDIREAELPFQIITNRKERPRGASAPIFHSGSAESPWPTPDGRRRRPAEPESKYCAQQPRVGQHTDCT